MNANGLVNQNPDLQKYFSEFSPSDIDKIEVLHIPAGTAIEDEKSEESSVYFIVRGICSVYRKIENGDDFNYYKISNNDVFGLTNVINPYNRLADAKFVAMTDITLFRIRKTRFKRFTDVYTKFYHMVTVDIITRLHDSLAMHVECKKYNSTINIVSYLIYSYRTYLKMFDKGYEGYVPISETRAIISDFTGISIRSINNTIDLLKNLEHISIIKGKVNINAEEYQKLLSYKADNI